MFIYICLQLSYLSDILSYVEEYGVSYPEAAEVALSV
jgi:hypothetical protein